MAIRYFFACGARIAVQTLTKGDIRVINFFARCVKLYSMWCGRVRSCWLSPVTRGHSGPSNWFDRGIELCFFFFFCEYYVGRVSRTRRVCEQKVACL